MIPVILQDVFTNAERGEGLLLLADASRRRGLRIFLGSGAQAIVSQLFALKPQPALTKEPRPLTYSYFASVLQSVNAELVEVQVTEMIENTYRAITVVRANGSEHRIDSRPSDAVTLAVCMRRPLFVAEAVMAQHGIDIDADGRPVELPEGFGSTRSVWTMESE